MELWYKPNGGVWLDSGLRQTGASGTFSFSPPGSGTYAFALVAVDGAGNRSAAVTGSGDCATAYINTAPPQNLLLPVNGGRLVSFTSQYSPGYGAANLTDGSLDTFWCSPLNPGPQSFIYAFTNGQVATLTSAVLWNYNQATYWSKAFELWTSVNGTNYVLAATGTLPASTNAFTVNLGGVVAKNLKLVIKSGYSASYWILNELAAYGTLGGTPDAVAPVAGSTTASGTAESALEPQAPALLQADRTTTNTVPQAFLVITSDDNAAHTNGLPAVDGNTNTMWVGKAGVPGWCIVVGYDPVVTLTNWTNMLVNLAPGSLTNIEYFGSLDATNWFNLTPALLQQGPVQFDCLWLSFPTNGTSAVPMVREIQLH